MSPANKTRSKLAAALLGVAGCLSQVPWDQVLAFQTKLLGQE
jgi:hypothetical protein